jgi:hypothetical protein
MEKFEQPTFNLVRSFSFVGDPTFAVNPDGDERLSSGPGSVFPSAGEPNGERTDYD